MKEKIESTFKEEFSRIEEKFKIISLSVNEAKSSKELIITNPGVYVFWKEKSIIKVGRSFTNSRKRALEHIRDNTRSETIEMKSLVQEVNNGILLINCIDREDYHWVAAIEVYLEKKLEPIIKSKRMG